MGHDHHDDHDGQMGHIQGFGVYAGTFAALVVLTGITVAAAQVDLGALWNDILAMAIASVKATLVITLFMHGKHEKFETWGFIWAPIILLATLLAALFIDYAGRQNDLYIEKATIKQLYPQAHHASSVFKDGHGGDHGAEDAGHGATDGDHGAEEKATDKTDDNGDH